MTQNIEKQNDAEKEKLRVELEETHSKLSNIQNEKIDQACHEDERDSKDTTKNRGEFARDKI